MPKVNGKIYYNNVTGDVLVIVNQNEGVWIRETDREEDIATYPQLKGVNEEVITCVELEWDEYKEDLLVSYPVRFENGVFLWQQFDDPPELPRYKPMSERIIELQKENNLLKAQNEALSGRTDFHEEVLTEIILSISS